MWIIKNDDSFEIMANDPSDPIAPVLIKQNPGATILRSMEPCINAVNVLLFALYSEPGDLIEYREPVLDQNGNPVITEDGSQLEITYTAEGPSRMFSAGNKARIDGLFLIIETKSGDELIRFNLEVVHGT